jgi:hypothetical protein
MLHLRSVPLLRPSTLRSTQVLQRSPFSTRKVPSANSPTIHARHTAISTMRPHREYPTYVAPTLTDKLRSSTCVYQSSGFVDELIDFGSGVYLRDTVSVQGVVTENVSFGYLTSYGNPSGLLLPAATIAGMSSSSSGAVAAARSTIQGSN